MKTLILAASLLALSSTALAQNVGVSVSIGQPGFYGQLDIGNMPRPPVIYAQPVIVHRPVRYVEQPLYLRVPPGHAKKWSKHCGAYNACGRNVYFVRDEWYKNDYAPRYRAQHGHGGHGDHGRDHGRDDRRDHDRGDRHDNKHDKHDKHDKHQDKHHGKGHNKD